MKTFIRLFCLFVLLNFTVAQAQIATISTPMDTRTKIAAFFTRHISTLQEKIWIHLDKPYYAAGDRIWFKAYLVDAVAHQPDTLSNFVYVELIDRKKQVVLSKKIKRDSCGFANNFKLPFSFAEGEYTLRAYTGWMLNFEPEFIFQQNIHIGNSITNELHTNITYTNPVAGKKQAIIRFLDSQDKPYPDVKVRSTVFDASGNQLFAMEQPTSVTGAIFVELPPDSIQKGGYMDVLFTTEQSTYRQTFFFPEDETQFAVQFFPEGGDLIAGVSQRVAFKGEGGNGYSTEVTGVVTDNVGDTVARFASEHDGMGLFLITPQPGQTYQAHVQAATGSDIRVVLPAVQREGYVLSTIQSQDQIRYQVHIHGVSPVDSLYIVGHVRGKCLVIEPLDLHHPVGVIPTEKIPEGILHLLVVDAQGTPHSERLVFVSHPQERELWQISPDKTTYGPREKVSLRLKLTDGDTLPVQGEFSVSITDRQSIQFDPLTDNIRSNLLLCSDLKGYIEAPGYYFKDDSARTRHLLDLVMMTHGWRRFNTQHLCTRPSFTPSYFLEHGQFITGHVPALFRKGTVYVVGLDDAVVFGEAEIDSTGHFFMDGLDLKDSTLLIFSARNKRGRSIQPITIDNHYPRPPLLQNKPFASKRNVDVQLLDNYLQQTREQYLYEDNMRVYYLKEVGVTARNPNHPRTAYDSTKLVRYKQTPLFGVVMSLPYIYRMRGEFFIRCRDNYIPISVSVNGKAADAATLMTYTAEDALYIETGDAIQITLKPGREVADRYAEKYRALGYAKSVEFYHPTYQTREQQKSKTPDVRTTLYWNPNLIIDSTGCATIEFYSDDDKKQIYDMTIQGISPNGKIYNYQNKIDSK